jgi:hypothetical protein
LKLKGIGLALILVILLAGCGTTLQVSTSLHVTRSESLQGYNFAPFERTVNDTTAVQRLYDAALALPTPQPGVYNCLNDIGLVYHLSFHGDRFTFLHMDLEATGCGWLHLNQTEVRQTTDSFLSLVVQTIGIPCLIPSACVSLEQ